MRPAKHEYEAIFEEKREIRMFEDCERAKHGAIRDYRTGASLLAQGFLTHAGALPVRQDSCFAVRSKRHHREEI